jgi:hypothetical protein
MPPAPTGGTPIKTSQSHTGPNGEALAGAPYPQWTVILGGSQRVAMVHNALEARLAETVAFPSKVYFFVSLQAAQKFANAHGGSASVPGIDQALNAANGIFGGATDVLGGFNIGNWFLRIGEILLGLVLVGVGVARITGVQNAVSQIVKTKVPI